MSYQSSLLPLYRRRRAVGGSSPPGPGPSGNRLIWGTGNYLIWGSGNYLIWGT